MTLAGLGLLLFPVTGLFAQVTTTPTLPPITSFLWGNTGVNAVGQGSFVSGSGYGYRYILPKNFNPNVKYPVIIYMHGTSECGTDNVAQLAATNNTANGALTLVSTANPDNQTNFPCFFIAPQVPVNENWSDATAGAAMKSLLAIFEAQYPNSFDTTRIYLTGNSLGGFGAYDLPYLLSQSAYLGYNPFAAIAPMSGDIGFYDGRSASTEPVIPIWTFHGVLDPTVPIGSSDDVDVPALRALGYTVIYSRYTNGTHGIWPLAYQHPQLLPWLFSQKLGADIQPLSNFDITGSAQPTAAALNLSGTASTAEGFNGLAWANTTTGQSGAIAGGITPTWSVANIPITVTPNLVQVTASAPNNTALVSGVATDYGGTLTVNQPYLTSAASGMTNVALNKPVTVSSIDFPADVGSNAVDGDVTTRWSSAYSDNQWIEIDLGQSYTISNIALNWETACGKNYFLQTSTDNITWTTQTTVTGNTTSGLLTYSYGTAPTARYVRMLGSARATAWGYSLYEFSVYGQPATTSGLVNVALGKAVTVSSVDAASDAGSNAVDGDTTTRWSSNYSDPQWIQIDLGSNYAISSINLTWQTACGKDYLLQTSLDGSTWTTQSNVMGNSTTGLLTYSYASQPTARYVRMYGETRATGWGYSLYEFAVYAQVSTQPSNLALNKAVTVSSVDFSGNAGTNAVDGDVTTRWSSAYTDNEWIVIDLGANHVITAVGLNWQTACGKNYLLQSSTDGSTWITQTTVTGNTTAGVLTYNWMGQPTARYVRMLGQARATMWGYSLFEFTVTGQ